MLINLKSLVKSNSTGVCIGNFDGMHIGHQSLFKALMDRSLTENITNKVFLTFIPHPKKVFSKKIPGTSFFEEITPIREKAKLAKHYGFNAVLPLKFSNALIELSPRDFVQKIIVAGLSANLVVVGYDWRFGKGRAGDLDALKAFGKEFGFQVVGVEKFEEQGQRVSSSQVRKALTEGNLELVGRLLGRKFALGARVIHGDHRGRTLGFPTANMLPKNQLLPARGVYITTASFDGKEHPAVSNIGIRPTFLGERQILETHILGRTDLDLYGQCLEVKFLERLRDEKKFSCKEELINQIKQDCSKAQSYFSK